LPARPENGVGDQVVGGVEGIHDGLTGFLVSHGALLTLNMMKRVPKALHLVNAHTKRTATWSMLSGGTDSVMRLVPLGGRHAGGRVGEGLDAELFVLGG
jgi:hypothetical protein